MQKAFFLGGCDSPTADNEEEMTPFQFIVLALAIWRVSSLLVHEDGPKGIFRWCRNACKNSELFWQLLQCVWCTSVWISTLFLLGWWLVPVVTWWVSLWLALSAASVGWHQICRNDIGNELLQLAKRHDEREDDRACRERLRAIGGNEDACS